MSTPAPTASADRAACRPQRRQRRGQRRAAQGAQRPDDHRGDGPGRDLRAAVLLSPEAVDRGELPHVPRRGREGAEAAAGLRDARRRGHEDLHALEAGDLGAESDDGVPAHQSSARLPDLRPGRRVRAAGPRDGLRPRRLALHRAEAHRQRQELRAARLDGHDALHPLHALRPVRRGDRRYPGARRELPQRPLRDRHLYREERRPRAVAAISSISAPSGR